MRVAKIIYCPCAVDLERPGRQLTESFKMAAEGKRSRPEKGFFKTFEDGVRVKLEKTHRKKNKCDEKKMYPIEVSTKF